MYKSSSVAWFSIMSTSHPVDIHICPPSVNKCPNQSQSSLKQRLQPGFLQVISKHALGSDIWKPGGTSVLPNILITTKLKSGPRLTTSYCIILFTQAFSSSQELSQQLQNHHVVHLNFLLSIWTSVSSRLLKRDLIILRA